MNRMAFATRGTMNRRTFNKLAGLAAVSALVDSTQIAHGEAAAADQEITLEDSDLLIAFDRTTGALTRLQRKSTQWTIERRPALGASFRLLAPMPNRRDNFVLGEKQRAASVEKIAPDHIQLQWKNLVSEHGGVLPITFTADVTLRDGSLTFTGNLDNQSSLPVETIDFPYFGDLNPPTPETLLQAEHMWDGTLFGDVLYPTFVNAKGYWGTRYPTKTIGSNQSQICLLQSPEQGVYVGVHDPAIRYYLEFTFEQHPGVLDWINDAVPQMDEIAGTPVHLEFRTCHFIFAHPHTSVSLAPVVMRSYNGDWHAGLDVYKEWRKTWFVEPKVPAWASDVHSWLQLQVDGAEQDYSIPYRDLLTYGQECAKHGVKAIQLVGWSIGGQDGGNPSMSTDPGLGTWQELHDAIAQIQAKGVKMILFGKPSYADMTTAFYKNELYKYAATDPYGIRYFTNGYSYTTPTQLAGINNRRWAIMDICCQKYRDIVTQEFEKMLALGASGWLFDEVLEHQGCLYSFSPDHGYEPPGYLFSADMPLARQFRAAANKVNPEFLFSGEGPPDWLQQYYTLGYYRIGDNRFAGRYISPQYPMMAAVRGFDSREDLNLCLLFRCVISYEPYNFKGHLEDFPLTLAYGKKIDDFRRRYREWVWDAEFRDTLGATLSADGAHRYAVYRTTAGKRAVVVVNLEMKKAIRVALTIPDAGTLLMATPEEPETSTMPATLTVPARSVVVVMEQ